MRKIILLLIFSIFATNSVALSAPPPEEVEELKNEAEIHFSGLIQEDMLTNDHSEDEHPTQERIMVIKIRDIYKGSMNVNDDVQVKYHYVPEWDLISYSGATSINIKKGDIVEVWANKEDGVYAPILNGYGIEMIKQNGERIEHIKEPFLQKSKRTVTEMWDQYSSLIVFIFIIIAISLLLIVSNRKQTNRTR